MGESNLYRKMIVFAGGRNWGVQQASKYIEGIQERTIWITDDDSNDVTNITASEYRLILGREYDVVVYDAYAGFNPDAFGSCIGTICSGGALVLITPPLESWPQYEDPEYNKITVIPYKQNDIKGYFIERLVTQITSNISIKIFREEDGLNDIEYVKVNKSDRKHSEDTIFRTEDQKIAVNTIKKAITGHRRRPAVLISDRGRGKSSALGIAAADLMQQKKIHIIVTAPRRNAVDMVFDQVQGLIPQLVNENGIYGFNGSCIEYKAPDDLFLNRYKADLVLVDEAAGIPTPILEKLLLKYSRICFATTVHGYEGTGRGFALRFNKILDKHTPDWASIRLNTPIRWLANDPLEHFSYKALLLDASIADDDVVESCTKEDCTIEILKRGELIHDEQMLSELFGLLVIAHYRTCPSDLRVLLDSPNISIFAIRYNGHVVATALLAEEGKLDKDLAKQIYQGHRRPRGHLIPQSLVFHSGIEEAATYRYGRVMRIAVHPALQRRGIGSYLLSTLAARLKNDGFDFIGASFGVTEELLRFWKNLNYNTVRIGLKREHTSGEHSAIVLHALNAESESLLNLTRNRFYRSFPVLLSESLRDLDVSLVTELMYRKDFNEKQRLDYYDWRDITTYAYASRGFEFCLAPIWELVYTAFSTVKIEEILQPLERDALIVKILQKRSWQSTAALLNLSGRAEVEKILRKALQHLFVKIAGKDLQEEIDKQISSQPV